MDDKTLLLKAARAAGYVLNAKGQAAREAEMPNEPSLWLTHATWWNPLTDSGQALDLAVTLEMDIGQMLTEGCVTVTALGADSDVYAHDVPWGTDPHAATRRAIVLVAADMTTCPECNDTGERDSGGTHPWGEPVYLPCDCKDAEIGKRWREDSSLKKWFPLTAERLAALEAENAALKREAHTWWTAARDAEKRAQRVPLDPLDIEEMWDEVTGMDVDDWHQEFARRIERRHGIGA